MPGHRRRLGIPVLAGPVEAAAYGNALVQARALGVLSGGLADLRAPPRAAVAPLGYDPTGDTSAWTAAEDGLGTTR